MVINVSEAKKKRYEYKLNLGRKWNGELIRKSFYSTKSKADARKKAEKYKNSLDQIPNKKINEYKNICNECENLTHQLSNLKSQKLENNSKYNQLNNKYQNETKLLSDIKDIYQAYKYALSVVFSNEINQRV